MKRITWTIEVEDGKNDEEAVLEALSCFPTENNDSLATIFTVEDLNEDGLIVTPDRTVDMAEYFENL